MLPEEIADARQRRYNGTVTWLRKPNPDLIIMRVRPDFRLELHLDTDEANAAGLQPGDTGDLTVCTRSAGLAATGQGHATHA